MRIKTVGHNFLLFLSIACFITFISCSKKGVIKTDIDKDLKNSLVNKDDSMLDKRYVNEGFINDELYRIVIISTKEDCEGNIGDIAEKSKKRAMISLEKYLSSINKRVDNNSRVKILDLMNNHGKFINKDNPCEDKNIYFFDIEKSGLKGYLNNISRW